MPVRIYDIAKKLGVESKVVIAKAKELGISTARVPSSTLDKITAEYLEEQMGYKPTPPAPPAAPLPETPPATPPTAPPATPPSPEPELAAAAPPLTVPAPPAVGEAGSPAPVPMAPVPPQVSPSLTSGEPPARELPPVPPITAPETGSHPVAPVGLAPEVESAVTSPEIENRPTAAPPPTEPALEAPPTATPPPSPPSAPPVPPPPKVGDKVGFIQLPTRPRPPERVPAKTPQRAVPGRAEPNRPRDLRGAPQPGRAAPATGQRAGAPAGLPPRETAKGSALPPLPVPTGEEIILKPPITVRGLAEQLRKKPFQLIADLMEAGVFATVNQAIEPEMAQRLCAKYNFRFKIEKREKGGGLVHRPAPKKEPEDAEDQADQLKPRAPVVTIMGHVDHGKTTLLDVIRKTNVAAGEAGGITQHIGAYSISVPHPERPKEVCQITFLDTPGHAAFSSMRARGANVTDIVVLVVAANDGVMPQTLEALSHAQAAKVPILVAVNKCDHPNANPMRVRQQLQEKGLTPDDWGGETIFVDVSALTKQGVDKLLGGILLQAELLELKANPLRRAKGNVVESGQEPGGPTATVLVRKGTLRVGDVVLCGSHYGKVRALINQDDRRLKEAGPSIAVKLLGLNGVPEAGAEFNVVENEKLARAVCDERAAVARPKDRPELRSITNLGELMHKLEQETAKILKVVVKADTQGSVEAIVEAVKKAETEKVSLQIIHSGVGTITETDVLLASASHAVILGFHTRVDTAAAELAKHEGVVIQLYAIIYELIDHVRDAMAGLLDPLLKEVVFGVAEVRKVFGLSKGGNVAGCVVASGRIVKGKARVMRRRNLVYEGIIESLRRFQDEASEVRAGMECGVRLGGFDDFQEGDTIECYSIEKIAQKL